MEKNKATTTRPQFFIRWNEPHAWEYDVEEANPVYKNVGETDSFLVELAGSNIVFVFKDKSRQRKQVTELGDSIKVNIESDNFNRIHINGISSSNLNQGFGKEIYSAMVESTPKGIISTAYVNGSSTEEAQRVWTSLIRSGNYFTAIIGPFKAIANNQAAIDCFVAQRIRAGWGDEGSITITTPSYSVAPIRLVPQTME